MSTVKAVTCDGCERTLSAVGHLYPYGWMRLTVTGRKLGADRATGIATVDVCNPKCAPKALEEAMIDLGEPVDA